MTTAVDYPLPRLISAITNSYPCVITFTVNHGYKEGQILTFHIPSQYGMKQLNNKTATVLSLTDNTVTIGIDTYSYDAFVYPVPGLSVYPPNAVPVGSGIDQNTQMPANNLECSFDRRRTA